MRAIEAAGLRQRFGTRTVLGPIDLVLESGESLAVVGENGSGKTTLLRLLATATRPSGGDLRLLGLDAATERPELRRRIGYLGDEAGHYPSLTALENLEFFCDLHGIRRSRAQATLELVGLVGAAGKRAGELSRGMAQRLGLARAVLHAPELLVLDEPDAGLDEEGRELLGRVAEGKTLVMATHDRELAAKLCGRILNLSAPTTLPTGWEGQGGATRGIEALR
ncbi:MAG: ABC transporter ATP-binding protein [Candidatus Dormibacteraeota bacterium]|nr:ABC transporter ATP-binding protein [Candidatus Dormibacteraeota bacterium]